MPAYIVKLKDYYLRWSTVVDAPTIVFDSREEVLSWDDSPNTKERLDRVDEFGTSCIKPTSAEELMGWNRAGPKETSLTLDELYRVYCLEEKIDGWTPYKTNSQ
ncbi:MAG: hypothetical protein ACXAEU_17160 [Candidatus Hodarchaeales archaeon]|jgi:hypothetical protein